MGVTRVIDALIRIARISSHGVEIRMKAAFAVLFAVVVYLPITSTSATADERCAQLLALNKQYAGIRLNDEQKAIKVQLVAWYKGNCGGVSGRRALLGNRSRDASQN